MLPLLLCGYWVSFPPQYPKTLGEIDLRGVGCDGELFKRIRSEYYRLQSFKTRIWLMRPAADHFVKVSSQKCTERYVFQFAVQDPLRVGILQKPLSIPPPQEVDAKNYMYAPCPLQDDPPMPQDIFLHYLSCECLDAAPAWLPRLPKKLDKYSKARSLRGSRGKVSAVSRLWSGAPPGAV
ncbi:hypothetical protein BGZ57DRAFT_570971 [Hyaloscypha finlandica]|nr:hypothetical protein BGZ57DRAFT_570971 [Hyaloscypha finlandica]